MGDWLGGARGALAAERILDAAGRVFLVHGVAVADMTDIAAEAGCSRATLYRYFENRQALRTAYVHREARRVAGQVVELVVDVADPVDRVVVAVTTAVRIVRETPVLAAWFAPDGTVGARMAGTSDVIESLCSAFLGESGTDSGSNSGSGSDEARWLVRVIVSLLTMPGRDLADEELMIRRFVAPLLVGEAGVSEDGRQR